MSAAEHKALVVDDEIDISRLLSITMQRMGIECVCAASVAEAKANLELQEFQLCLTDMHLPDGNGMEIIEHIQQNYSQIPVAMITAYGSVDSAVQALKSGAFDFVSKPIQLDQIRDLVSSAMSMPVAPTEIVPDKTKSLVGKSRHMAELQKQIDRLARSQAPVFIHGESGVGKELVAHAIHERSPRASRLLLPVNCGAIPVDLIESELFGHLKGSFTGASEDKSGIFQSASGGSLFLDEVADLPLSMQVKLLRAIQERQVRPIGAQEEIAVDVRIMSAAQMPLAELVAAGTFRQDLYYRLDVISLCVPPLRDRLEDLPELVEHFVEKISRRNDQPVPSIDKKVYTMLQQYSFPGNVRELENILERSMALCEAGEITVHDLKLPNVPAPVAEIAASAPAAPGLNAYIEDMEREKIVKVLDSTRWNRTRAAQKLGISLRALRYKMQKLALTSKTSGGKKHE